MYFGGHQSSCLLNCFMSKKCTKTRKVLENFKSNSKPKVMEKSRKVMEFEELIRVRTMISSGGQTGKNISMITVNCIRSFFCNWKV